MSGGFGRDRYRFGAEWLSIEAITDSAHYTGFPNRTDTALGWDDGTYTLTLTATDDEIWVSGIKYTIDTLTYTLTVAQEATSGLYWFWITVPGGIPQLNASTTQPEFYECWTATVYWNTTTSKGILGEERHWFGRDRWWHEYTHETIGARWFEGFGLTKPTTAFDANIDIAAGEFYDEDIEHLVGNETACTVLWHDGSAEWQWATAQATPYKVTGTDLQYNNGTTLATATANRYVNYWCFATPDLTDPIWIVIGTAQFTTLAGALEEAFPALGDLPSEEMKVIYRFTYRSDGVPSFIDSADYRGATVIPSTGGTSDHGSLGGLGDDDHGHYLLIDGTRPMTSVLGVGIVPTTDFHVAHAVLNENAEFYHETYSTGGADYSRIRLRKSNTNTLGSLVETDNLDILGAISFGGVNSSSGWTAGARIYASQGAAAGAVYIPSTMVLGGSAAATGPWSTVYLSDDDKVGIRVADPTVALDILGDMLLTGNSSITGTLGAGETTLTGELITNGNVSSSGAAIDFSSKNFTGVGTVVCGTITNTGSSTFDTTTLVIDSVNHWVGVGDSPAYTLDVTTAIEDTQVNIHVAGYASSGFLFESLRDGGEAGTLMAGLDTCIFGFSNTGTFTIQTDPRADILASPGTGTTLFKIESNARVTFEGATDDLVIYPVGAAAGDMPAGPRIYADGTNKNLKFHSRTTVGSMVIAAAYDGGRYNSMWEFASAAADPDLILVKSGGNVGIAVTDPDALLEIFGTATQLKLSYDATNYTTFATGSDGDLTITTVDSDGAAGHIFLVPNGLVRVGSAAAPTRALDVSGDLGCTGDFGVAGLGGFGVFAATGLTSIDTTSTCGAAALKIAQTDNNEPFVDFVGDEQADGSGNISTGTPTATTKKWVRVNLDTGGDYWIEAVTWA